MKTFVLLFECQDKKGIVARISNFIFHRGGNIVNADQHSTDPEGGYFFLRVEFTLEGATLKTLVSEFEPVAREFEAEWKIQDKEILLNMGIFVSRPDHCLLDLLYLWRAGELKVKIPFVLSNYEGHRKDVERYDIPFHFVAAKKDNRMEPELFSYVKDSADFLVLARYMLVLSKDFLNRYGKDIINIHHGFLPSFRGANPYQKALDEGVKVIGATAHFVNENLDEGPIICQKTERVSHKDNLDSLKKKGRILEEQALSEALCSYTDYRVIRHGNKTVVF